MLLGPLSSALMKPKVRLNIDKILKQGQETERNPEKVKQKSKDASKLLVRKKLPRTGDHKTDIAIERAEIIGLDMSDLTQNRIDELYHDAIQRGLVEGEIPKEVSDKEQDSWQQLAYVTAKENRAKRLAQQWEQGTKARVARIMELDEDETTLNEFAAIVEDEENGGEWARNW